MKSENKESKKDVKVFHDHESDLSSFGYDFLFNSVTIKDQKGEYEK